MATIVIQTPNVTKTYTLNASQVQRLLAFADHHIGPDSTTAEQEAWIARHFFTMMRDALYAFEDGVAIRTARNNVVPLDVVES